MCSEGRGQCHLNPVLQNVEYRHCRVRHGHAMPNKVKPIVTHLLSVSASRGPVFRRYLLNGQTDQDETLAREVSKCDLIFHNILL